MASYNSVEIKLFHARQHLESLKAILQGYFESKPCGMIRDADSTLDQPTFTFSVMKPIPARLGLVLGDCLQNVRSALDYLIWELVLANQQTPGKHNMFPICTTEKSFKDAIRARRLEGVAPEPLALIDSLQPYRAGDLDAPGLPLTVLDELVNINKHRRVLFTVVRSIPGSSMETIQVGSETWGRPSVEAMQSDVDFGRKLTLQDAQTHGSIAAFVAIGEGPAKGSEATLVASALLEFTATEVAGQFTRFFE